MPVANWANKNNVGDSSSPTWQKANLTTINVAGQTWQVYKPAANDFKGFLTELSASGYPLKSSGGFNYRTIRGGSKLSQHAFGNAIDINASTNPMTGKGGALVTDLPSNVGDLAEKYNLVNGASFNDPMHFEWKGTPSGNLTPEYFSVDGLMGGSTQSFNQDTQALTDNIANGYGLDDTGKMVWQGDPESDPAKLEAAQVEAAGKASGGIQAADKSMTRNIARAIVEAGNQQAKTLASAVEGLASTASATSQAETQASAAQSATVMGWLGNRILQIAVFIIAAIFIGVGLKAFITKNT